MNPDRAERVIEFIETFCFVTEGPHAGQLLKLREWQKLFVRDVYTPMRPDGRRLIRKAPFSLPKKNGKTGLAAGLLLAHLVGPESEPNGEIYSAANDVDQAKIIFKAVKDMVEWNPILADLITVTDSQRTMHVHRSDLPCGGSRFKALSADAKTKQGFKPTLIVYDELGEAPNDKLLTALQYGFGARSEPLFIVISTQNEDPEHPLSVMIDAGLTGREPSTVCHLYCAPDNADLMDREVWAQCNPAFGDFRDADDFEVQANMAVSQPVHEASFRLYLFNQRVSRDAALINGPDWRGCQMGDKDVMDRRQDDWDFDPGEEIYVAADMAARTDLTAIVAVSAGDTSRVKSWFFKPDEVMASSIASDVVRYDLYRDWGWLRSPPGRSLEPDPVVDLILDLSTRFVIKGLTYDPAMMGVILDKLTERGVAFPILKTPQTYVGMSPGLSQLEHEVVNGTLKHDGNPLLSSHVTKAIIRKSDDGLRRFIKPKNRTRIDGAVALAMALGLKAKDLENTAPKSPWDDPDFNLIDEAA